jgi:hypothetical protein
MLTRALVRLASDVPDLHPAEILEATVHEAFHVFVADQRDVFSKAATIIPNQFAPMLIFFRLHFLKDLRGGRTIRFQSSGEVGVNARIGFLGRNRERENFLFRKVFEIFLATNLLRL